MKRPSQRIVFIFGAGADKQFYNVPLGNEFILHIFSSLKMINDIVSMKNRSIRYGKEINDENSFYEDLYRIFKNRVLSIAKLENSPNYFYDWKQAMDNLMTKIIKRGMLNVKEQLISWERDSISINENVINILRDLRKSEDELSKTAIKFLISAIINAFGYDFILSSKMRILNMIKDELKKEKELSDIEMFFEDIEPPVRYNPESMIKKTVRKLLEHRIENLNSFPDSVSDSPVDRVINEYVLNIFDYSLIFDDVYYTLMNYEEISHESHAKVLKSFHFILSTYHVIKKIH